MVGRVVLGLAALSLLATIVAAWFLIPAHLQIRDIHPPLPDVESIRARVAATTNGPVRLSWINTASQETPRSSVLGDGDPDPDLPYRLCHSSFVLEWEDGRVLLVDAAMTRSQAESFGAAGEWAGAGPVRVLTTVAEQLQRRAKRAAGLVFTHLHVDHVDGVNDLCDGAEPRSLAVWMTLNQSRQHNYTTSAAFSTLQSLPCVNLQELPDEDLAELPGFPGVFVLRAAGHTPGTQVIVAALRHKGEEKPTVFTGDVVNHIDGIELDLGKPSWYRALVVPEDDRRLGEVRRLIRSLRDDAGFEVLVSHDENALEASGVARYAEPPPGQP